MGIFEQQKFFNELSFFTLSNAAPALSDFFEDTITISNPKTSIVLLDELKEKTNGWVYATISFNDGKIGETHVLFKEQDAIKLAQYAIHKKLRNMPKSNEWGAMNVNAVEEILNILGGNMTEVLTVVFGEDVEIGVPELEFTTDSMNNKFLKNENLIFNDFTVYLGNEEKIKMKEVAKQTYYEDLVKQLKKRV